MYACATLIQEADIGLVFQELLICNKPTMIFMSFRPSDDCLRTETLIKWVQVTDSAQASLVQKIPNSFKRKRSVNTSFHPAFMSLFAMLTAQKMLLVREIKEIKGR